MTTSICGAECAGCPSAASCGGCRETNGKPFGGECPLAVCCLGKGQDSCGSCGGTCALKAPLIAEFNALGIPDMGEVADLNVLPGAYINLAYPLPNGQTAKLLKDDKIYFGNQMDKPDGRCYGLAGDETFLLVCEYGCGGADPEIVLYRRRQR